MCRPVSCVTSALHGAKIGMLVPAALALALLPALVVGYVVLQFCTCCGCAEKAVAKVVTVCNSENPCRLPCWCLCLLSFLLMCDLAAAAAGWASLPGLRDSPGCSEWVGAAEKAAALVTAAAAVLLAMAGQSYTCGAPGRGRAAL